MWSTKISECLHSRIFVGYSIVGLLKSPIGMRQTFFIYSINERILTMIEINKGLLDELFEKARGSERLRMNYDLRTSADDNSQRMLNALLPGTSVPVHRHPRSNENVLLLCGKLVEVIYEEVSEFHKGSEVSEGEAFLMAMESCDVVKRTRLVEKERIVLDPSVGSFGCVVPAEAWHTVEVLEPSVIYEAKDGKYGEDGSETWTDPLLSPLKGDDKIPEDDGFSNSLGDLKKNIEYLIGMERLSGSMEVCSPVYVSRMLNVPLAEVEEAMREMGIV